MDKVIDYLDETSELPEEETEVSPFRSNFMTTSKVRKKTRENLRELERITGNRLNIVV